MARTKKPQTAKRKQARPRARKDSTEQHEIERVIAAAVAGRLTERIDAERHDGFMRTVATGINQLLESVSTMVSQINQAADAISAGAGEISLGNANLSTRTQEQSSALEQTA